MKLSSMAAMAELAATEETYPRCEGMRYTDFLTRLHQAMVFDWYLEVGCRGGRTFAPVRGPTIAVDPFFKAEINIIGAKPKLFVFQQTSDDFFASGVLKALGVKLSFAFLDGMHLIEYLLRDFINTEANATPGSVIALHDCLPFNSTMLSRDLENLPRGPWTGDVWKIIPILQRYRPDLKLTILDAKPTGLVLVSNLAPRNTALKRNLGAILAEWVPVDLPDYGGARFYDSFEQISTADFVAADYPLFKSIRRSPETILTPTQVSK